MKCSFEDAVIYASTNIHLKIVHLKSSPPLYHRWGNKQYRMSVPFGKSTRILTRWCAYQVDLQWHEFYVALSTFWYPVMINHRKKAYLWEDRWKKKASSILIKHPSVSIRASFLKSILNFVLDLRIGIHLSKALTCEQLRLTSFADGKNWY